MLPSIFAPTAAGMSGAAEITFIEFLAHDSMNMGSIIISPNWVCLRVMV